MTVPEGTYDELAGVVDLFGALTRTELRRALEELAFKRGEGADPDALAAAVDDAVERYYLVGFDPDSEVVDDGEPSDDARLLAVGPTAFPALPPNAEDLPHILDAEARSVDRAALGERALDRLEREADEVAGDGDAERAERLLDVSYDLEAWAPVDATAVRDRLDGALEAKSEEELE
jgi:hypothetical protein